MSDAFKALDIPIIDTDIVAREVLLNDTSLLAKLIDAFGADIINENSHLDRTKLRNIAFLNNKNKERLDNIMHPAIRQATLEKIQHCEKQQHSYCMIVVPLLIETGFIKLVDRVLVVTAPLERKLQRLEKRSQLNATQANKIIEKQSTDEEKLALADDIISNDSDIKSIQIKVAQLHQQYLTMS